MVLYEERQWASLRIMAFFFLLPVLGSIPIFVVAGVVATVPWDSVPWVFGLGVLGAIFIWSLQVTRRMQVRASGLRMSRNPIPFGDIASARIVQGDEAKQIRDLIAGATKARGGFVVSRVEWDRIHGSWQQPWMRDAVFVQLKPTSRAVTDKWIIGTRHPQQLLQLIQDGMARAEVAAPAAVAASAT